MVSVKINGEPWRVENSPDTLPTGKDAEVHFADSIIWLRPGLYGELRDEVVAMAVSLAWEEAVEQTKKEAAA